MFRDASKHAWTNFFAAVEGEHLIAPSFARQNAVRAGLALLSPSQAIERAQHPDPLWPQSSLSSSEHLTRRRWERLSIVNPIGDDPKRQRDRAPSRLRLSRAISQNAGKRRNLGDPSPVLFAVDFDLEHTNLRMRAVAPVNPVTKQCAVSTSAATIRGSLETAHSVPAPPRVSHSGALASS
jgi:hypothetical protein